MSQKLTVSATHKHATKLRFVERRIYPAVGQTLSELRSKNGVRDAKRDAMEFFHAGVQQLQNLPGVLIALTLSQAWLIHSRLVLTGHALVRNLIWRARCCASALRHFGCFGVAFALLRGTVRPFCVRNRKSGLARVQARPVTF